MKPPSVSLNIDSIYKGYLDAVSTSLSGEFGQHSDLAWTVRMEPQIETACAHADAEDLTLSNSMKAATYEIGDWRSLRLPTSFRPAQGVVRVTQLPA